MADLSSSQPLRSIDNLIGSERFARVTQFMQDPFAERALREFAAAIPWARDASERWVRADDDLYLRSIADWSEEILRAYELGCSYYGYSTGISAGSVIDSSPSWFVLDELIRCSRPEGLRYRALLQRATFIPNGPKGGLAPYERTGWYDNGCVQSWVFVFWKG